MKWIFVLILPCNAALSQTLNPSTFIDEYWPKHTGPLYEELVSQGYVDEMLNEQSKELDGWYGRADHPAFDSIEACGISFSGHLRKRQKGTYLILVIKALDAQDHELKWISSEYRLNRGGPIEFLHRIGNDPEFINKKNEKRFLYQPLQRHVLKYTGIQKISGKFTYLEVLKFPDPKKLANSKLLQIYLPWVDDCTKKPELLFDRPDGKQTDWSHHLGSYFSGGVQFATGFATDAWRILQPSPSVFGRYSNYSFGLLGVGSFGGSAEIHGAFLNGILSKFWGNITRLSGGYSIWVGEHFSLIPEIGLRIVYRGDFNIGFGGAINLVYEVPGTRNPENGNRMIIETGCDFSKHFEFISPELENFSGYWTSCRVGVGLGW